MSELLFEIVSGEVPALMHKPAIRQLESCIKEMCDKIFPGIEIKIQVFMTPRRLGFCAVGIPGIAEFIQAEVKGPRIDAPTAALEGFLKKYRVSIEQLDKRGVSYFLPEKREYISSKAILGQELIKILRGFRWSKSLKINLEEKWVRPIDSILCILDSEVVGLEFCGILSSNSTVGHRIMAPQEIRDVVNFADYEKKLRNAYVEIFPEKREENIVREMNLKAAALGLKVMVNQSLLEEVVGLLEWPVILLGMIPLEFMDIPKEVIIATLTNNQRYFMLENNVNEFTRYFIVVSNVVAEGSNQIIYGNEKVIAARLSDAHFFYNNDLKTKLSQRKEYLSNLSFHADVGSVGQKVEATKILLRRLFLNSSVVSFAEIEKAEMVIDLMKCDLLTDMVKEFPELEGIMGYYYALNEGFEVEIATAIKEHYMPKGGNDTVPFTKLGAMVALADKLDTLNQMFAVSIKPTGSKDPYALRRAAIGVIRILNNSKFDIEINAMRKDVLSFIQERIKAMISDIGMASVSYSYKLFFDK